MADAGAVDARFAQRAEHHHAAVSGRFRHAARRLAEDLAGNFDYALHLGQAPGSSRIQFEAIGLNIGGSSSQSPDQYRHAGRRWAGRLSHHAAASGLGGQAAPAGIPAQVSFHAGTYLCNATLYLTHYLIERSSVKTQAAFIHVPLDVSQVVNEPHGTASLPVYVSAQAVRLILEELK